MQIWYFFIFSMKCWNLVFSLISHAPIAPIARSPMHDSVWFSNIAVLSMYMHLNTKLPAITVVKAIQYLSLGNMYKIIGQTR